MINNILFSIGNNVVINIHICSNGYRCKMSTSISDSNEIKIKVRRLL